MDLFNKFPPFYIQLSSKYISKWKILQYFVIFSFLNFTLATNGVNICGPELESKFLSSNGKCPFSGLVPVKGSCTEYIPCISFGGELLKPLKRAECPKSARLGFNIETLRCGPSLDLSNCPQKSCYSKGRAKPNEPAIYFPLEIVNHTHENEATSPLPLSTTAVIEDEWSSTELGRNETNITLVSSSYLAPVNNLIILISSVVFIFND